MEEATTRIQNTNGYRGRGRLTADITHVIRGQLLHPGLEQIDVVGDVGTLDETDLEFNVSGTDYKIPRVQEVVVMGSPLSNEADAMSAMRNSMNIAMTAMRAEMYFYKIPGTLE